MFPLTEHFLGLLAFCCYQLLSEDEIETLKRAAREVVAVDPNKMFEPCYNLNTGLPVAAATGLEDRMCVKAIFEK
jgi:hypothetical protein